MSDIQKGDIVIIGKGDETFVGIVVYGDKDGFLLKNARQVLFAPFAIASEGLNEDDMEKHVSCSVEALAIYGVDMVVKPDAEISSMLAKLFGLEDIAGNE
jgi:hypothetical protein